MVEFNLDQERFFKGIEVGRRLKALKLSQADDTENVENENNVSASDNDALTTEE